MRETILESIQSAETAYLLGWLATGVITEEGQITLKSKKKDAPQLLLLQKQLEALHLSAGRALELLVEPQSKSHDGAKKPRVAALSFRSRLLAEAAWRWLGREERHLPKLEEDAMWLFLRGLFEQSGQLSACKKELRCSIVLDGALLRRELEAICKIPWVEEGERLVWYGNNALDLLERLYRSEGPFIARRKKRFLRWAACIPGVTTRRAVPPIFRWNKITTEAVGPFKERASDSGYDLTLIRKMKSFGAVTLFGTGVQVEPPYGWYFDLVPRSSISKTGYMLANNIGVIDRTYRGEILVPLIKLDPSAPEIELPSRLVQIIPRPIIHGDFVEIPLPETARGEGGFGSTQTKR